MSAFRKKQPTEQERQEAAADEPTPQEVDEAQEISIDDVDDAVREDARQEQEILAEDQTAELIRERDELKDRLLRTMADYQNYARRAEQNIVQAREQATMDFGRKLLTVLDQFEHAFAAMRPAGAPEIEGEGAAEEDALMAGVRMVHQEMLRVLEQMGIRPMDAKPGDEFDPSKHEAMMRQEAEGIESGHIAFQLQTGYCFGDRTLRPAKVAVVP